MSIFDDTELINSLINAGIDFNNKFAQQQPSAAAAQALAQQKRVFELAKSLGTNMQRDLGDPDAVKKVAPIGTVSGQPANFTMLDGRTLGHFIDWAARSGIQWKGKRIAWLEGDTTKPADAWSFESLDADLSKRDEKGQPLKKMCYADKEGLISYLSYLRDEAVPNFKDSKPLEIVVKNLIGELNRSLPRDQQQPVKVAPGKKTNDTNLDPNLVVDAFPDDVITTDANGKDIRGLGSAPDFNGMRVKLTLGNLADLGSFTRWLYGMKVKTPDSSKAVGAMDLNEGDPCSVVRALYNRALALSGVASAHLNRQPNYDKMVARYLQAIRDFGPQIKDPKTQQSCSLTSTTEVGGTTGTGATGATGTSGQNQVTQPQIEALGKIMASLPLHTTNIDTNRINRFLYALVELDRNTKTGALSHNIAYGEIQRIMGAMDGLMIGKYPQINLTMNLQSIQGLLRNGWKDASAFIDNLRQLIIQTSAMLSVLDSTWGYVLNPAHKQKLKEQINYVSNDNISKINSWASALTRSIK